MFVASLAVRRIIKRFLLLSAVLALGACSAWRLAYNNAPELLYVLFDDQFDFTEAQAEVVKAELKNMQAWHRSNELPELKKLLGRAQAMLAQPSITPTQVCAVINDAEPRVSRVFTRSLPAMAAVVTTATPQQLSTWQKGFDKRNATFKQEYISASRDKQLAKRLDSAQSSFERIYGKLNDAQRKALAQQLAASTWDAELALRESIRRQQDGMRLVRQLLASNATAESAAAQLQNLFSRPAESPDAAYRAQAQRTQQEVCERSAQLHNSATPDQRAAALKTLAGYAEDLQSLMLLK